MESTVERLVEKIYHEGVEKAEQRAAEILESAKKEAAAIRESAERDAKAILDQARAEAARLKQNTDAELSLAATAALSRLRQSIVTLVREKTIVEPVNRILQDETFLKEVIMSLVQKSSGDYTLTVPEHLKQKLEAYFHSAATASLPGLTIEAGKMRHGFLLQRRGDGFALDFTDEALQAFFEEYLKPATAALFRK